jgi:hypothetical protein
MLTYKEFRARALANPEVRAEYEKLKPEFMLFDELLRARKAAGLNASRNSRADGNQNTGDCPPRIRWRQ